MRKNLFFIFLITFILSCGGPKLDEQAIKPPTTNEAAIKIYQEGLITFLVIKTNTQALRL